MFYMDKNIRDNRNVFMLKYVPRLPHLHSLLNHHMHRSKEAKVHNLNLSRAQFQPLYEVYFGAYNVLRFRSLTYLRTYLLTHLVTYFYNKYS